jgi:hypothetical protein
LVIEVEDRVGEGVPERMMQRLVGIGRVEALLDQTVASILAAVRLPGSS